MRISDWSSDVCSSDLVGHEVHTVDGNDVPVLEVRNSGNAHGRLRGFVDGRDADGKTYALQPSTLPILPGETRDIALAPQADNADAPVPVIAWPLRPEGRLDSGKQRLDIAATIDR